MAQTGKYGTYEFMQLIQEFNKQVKNLPDSTTAYKRKLLKCSEFWWLHKGTIPAVTIAILLKVERTDLIHLINGQIKERGANVR
jgi:hypothetical protein